MCIKLEKLLILLAVVFCSWAFLHAQEKKVIDTTALQKEIQEVKVLGKKRLIERKVDRLIFNVENSVSAQGGDAVDALKVTPGVKIQGEEIKLAGKSSVKVMVNDKMVQMGGEELQNYLKSIPTANIQKIEVITNPPAKYEAEGNSGLINIKLKEAKQNNLNTILRSSYQQATYENLTHGIGLAYKKNKFSTLADINYRYGRNLYTNKINYYYPSEHWNNSIFNRNHRKNLGTLLNLQYSLTEKSTIGAQFLGSFSDNSADEYNDNNSYSYTDGSMMKHYKTDGVSQGKPKNISVNLNYNQKLDDKGKDFSIDADYFNSQSPKNSYFNSSLQDFSLNNIDKQFAINYSTQTIKNYSIKSDFELPYNWANLSFGVKISVTTTDNTVEANFFNQDNGSLFSEQKDHFQYRENTNSLYFSTSKSFGEKWEIKVGLRGENTQTKAISISTNQETVRNYSKLFPTAYLSYKPNENNTFSINYGRRIQRPGFWEMNPARWYMNPKSYAEGNPFLQPTFIENFEMNYAYKSLLNFNFSYAKINDFFGQQTFHNLTNDSQIFKRLNYANGIYSGGTFTISYNPFKWWESSTDFSMSYSELSPYIDILAKRYSGWSGYTSTNNTFTLNKSKTLLGSLYYEYNYPSKSGYGTSSPMSTLNIGFKYLAIDKKLTIGINFEDIFRKSFMTYENNSSNIHQTFQQYYDTRLIRLSLTYKLGNSKMNVKKREGGNEEERRRSN